MDQVDYPRHTMRMEGEGLEKVCPYRFREGMDVSKCPHILEKRDHAKKIKTTSQTASEIPHLSESTTSRKQKASSVSFLPNVSS
jgi:hypothetical protein